jgi:hypothetical protein
VFEPQQKIFFVELTAHALESPTETEVKVKPAAITGTKSPQHCKFPEVLIKQVVLSPVEIIDPLLTVALVSGTLLESR